MNRTLIFQRKQMIDAVQCINAIEDCEAKISNAEKVSPPEVVAYFQGVRAEAVEKYAQAMTNLMGQDREVFKALNAVG